MSKFRQEKMSGLIRDEVGAILLKELDLSIDAMVTVTRAIVSEDLMHARVYVSVLPDQLGKVALDEITKNIYHFQQLLNKKLRIRPIPKLYFVLDESEAEAAKIEKLVSEVIGG